MPSTTILYESDGVVVTADLRETPGVIIAYSFVTEGVVAAPFGDGPLQSMGFSGIFVSAKTFHWWQTNDRDRMCAALGRAAERYPARIGYGVSMGAYGALAFGGQTGCTRVLAIAPQTAITDPSIPTDPKWARHLSRHPVVRDSIAEDLGDLIPDIVFDPHQPIDRLHVDRLRQHHFLRELHYPFAGHKLLLTLKQCGIMKNAVRTMLADGITATHLRADYRRTRHRSERYLLNLASHLCERGQIDRARGLQPWVRSLRNADALERFETMLSAACSDPTGRVTRAP